MNYFLFTFAGAMTSHGTFCAVWCIWNVRWSLDRSGFNSPWFWYNFDFFVHFGYWVVCSTQGSFKGSWVSEVGIRVTQAVLWPTWPWLCCSDAWATLFPVNLGVPPLPWAMGSIFLHRNPCKILYHSTLYFPLEYIPPTPPSPFLAHICPQVLLSVG